MSKFMHFADRTDSRDSPMLYRRLGQTELNVSIIGFGASPLGDVFGQVDPAEGGRAVSSAIDLGINFFDVSPYYGRTLAEERLGHALVGRRASIILATKCGRYGPQDFDFSAERVRQGVEESLKRLRTDYVDLLQAHDIEFGNAEQIINETIPTIRRLQEEGKARYIGISGYPLKILMHVAERAPVDSILSYCRYDLLCNDLDTVLMPLNISHAWPTAALPLCFPLCFPKDSSKPTLTQSPANQGMRGPIPKNAVSDPITGQEMAFAHLVLSGTMNDRRAAETGCINPDNAAKPKPSPASAPT